MPSSVRPRPRSTTRCAPRPPRAATRRRNTGTKKEEAHAHLNKRVGHRKEHRVLASGISIPSTRCIYTRSQVGQKWPLACAACAIAASCNPRSGAQRDDAYDRLARRYKAKTPKTQTAITKTTRSPGSTVLLVPTPALRRFHPLCGGADAAEPGTATVCSAKAALRAAHLQACEESSSRYAGPLV